jgi:hypothetical protein
MKTAVRTTALAAALATAIGVAAAPPSSATTKTRTKPIYTETQTQTYVLPTVGTDDVVMGEYHVGGGAFKAPIWARYVSVSVVDASGLPTAGTIEVEAPYTHDLTTVGSFCGRTTQSYPVTGNQIGMLWIPLHQGPCADGTIAAGSTGTVSVTFTS